MKMHRCFFIWLALISLTACCRFCPEVPTAFRASTGCAEYHCEAYRWINTQNGPIELNHSWVTTGVMTDKTLMADDSDIAGLCIGGKAWIRDCVVRGISSIGDEARIYDSEVCGKLHVGNNLTTEDSVYHDKVVVCGDVTAKCCCFESKVEAAAEIVCLSATTTGDLHIHPSGPYYDPQVVRISHGSVIDGNIYFYSLRGKVVIDDCSCITGEIFGGHVIKPFECYNQPFYQALEN